MPHVSHPETATIFTLAASLVVLVAAVAALIHRYRALVGPAQTRSVIKHVEEVALITIDDCYLAR